ncbi:DUF5103 domain-containing protein [Flavobacteriaceae bacterium F89]|uniref:DUF5103 domain-containing protein n=1 Tax=Cerina litoralis TaxID=2874477 RepID=A0AAE3JSD7_9FLAO|nr:type IX secretion system plug protein domain-containing protein [Cerina litoralis]MCG2460472.1 DUF5103 domain-containing protein [Cerina litoralis]
MRHYLYCVFVFLTLSTFGQVEEKAIPPEHIKTIILKGPTQDQFPVVTLDEPINLEFDDLLGNEQDYYYKIVHCDYNWESSKLLKSQYISGLDNQRITRYRNSFNTLQSYSNYKLTIPNENIRLKISGNYVLQVFNNRNDLQFSRRFVVYQNRAVVGVVLKNSRDLTYFQEKQVVQFNINIANIQVVNPKQEIKVAILQNYYWPTAKKGILPQFTMGQNLVYKYDKETAFNGGNEFFNFDTKDLYASSSSIARVALGDKLYQHYLFTGYYRYNREYTYNPDINGDFEIRTLQGEDMSTESEYTIVHFSLPYHPELGLDEVYVFGKFNNYELTDANKMVYNESNGMLEASIEMKQGFYNYKYVVKKEDGTVDLGAVCGNFNHTENNYLVLVYYRHFGDLYDSIIGIGTGNSQDITN